MTEWSRETIAEINATVADLARNPPMTEVETAVREALAKMTPGLKADPYGPPGRYTMDADGCIVIRTESPNDQAALITFQQHAPALLAELDAARAENARLREALKPFCDDEVMDGLDGGPDDQWTSWPRFRLGDFRRARADLEASHDPR